MSVYDETVRGLAGVIKARNPKTRTSAYDTPATVRRVENGVAYVHIDGGVDETPVKLTIASEVGDSVQVRVSGGSAWITGNASRPPTDDSLAIKSHIIAQEADSKAVTAVTVADEANGTAVYAKDTAESILIYDHGYVLTNGVALFTAYVYQGGVDIKESFSPSQFTWYLKTEDGTEYLGAGYTISVSTSDCGYGAEIIGKFTINDDARALSSSGEQLATASGDGVSVRASGEYVKIRELPTANTVYSSEKILIVGNENEHLVTMQTLQSYLNDNLDKQVLFNTTAVWDSQLTLVSKPNTLYVYTDRQIDSGGNVIAGIKVGDGNAYVIDLPFIDSVVMEHISDSDIHITSAERNFWNNKVSCYYTGTDQLIFTTS